MNKVITPEQIENLNTYLDESGIGGKPDEVYYKGLIKAIYFIRFRLWNIRWWAYAL